MKTQPNRLTEVERKARRQHQIHLGKSTQGYRNLQTLRQNGVIKEGPKTPDPNVPNVSKRSFDKEIREWRRKLHAFDNVDFDALKAKIYEERKHLVAPELLDDLLHKEIRALVDREMLLRKQPTKQRNRQDDSSDGRSELLSKHAKSRRFKESNASSDSGESKNSDYSNINPIIEDNKRMMIETDVLRLKVQELTYQNTSLMERLHQQDMLLRSLITEPEIAAPQGQGFSDEFDEYSYMMTPTGAEEPKWLKEVLSSGIDGVIYRDTWRQDGLPIKEKPLHPILSV